MKLGLWTGFFLLEDRTPDLKTMKKDVERLKAAGFTCGEMDERNAYALFVSVPEKEAKANAEALKDLEFFSQLHAPKPKDDIEEQLKTEDRILSAAEIMKIPTIVTHPFITEDERPEPKDKSLAYLKRFTEKAKERNVHIALENQIYPVDMDYYLAAIPDLGVNIDFAHATATGYDCVELICKYGERLYGLHVADSDGREEDYHILPGQGILPWNSILEALEKTHYSYDFHLEIVHERSDISQENDTKAKEAYAFVCCILNGNKGSKMSKKSIIMNEDYCINGTTSRNTTLQKKVYDILIAKLMNRELLPGQVVNRRDMASQLQVSVSPVLEAFVKLEQEGFVQTIPRKGTIITLGTEEEMIGQLIVREALDIEAAGFYCGEKVKEHYDELKEYAQALDQTDMFSIEHAKKEICFHASLVNLAGYKRLLQEYLRVNRISFFYRLNSRLYTTSSQSQSHVELLDNLCTNNIQEAQEAIRYHLRSGKPWTYKEIQDK